MQASVAEQNGILATEDILKCLQLGCWRILCCILGGRQGGVCVCVQYVDVDVHVCVCVGGGQEMAAAAMQGYQEDPGQLTFAFLPHWNPH